MRPLHLVILLAIIAVAVLVGSRCKLRCNKPSFREGLSHRLTTTHPLADDTYSNRSLPSYTQKWQFGAVEGYVGGMKHPEPCSGHNDCRSNELCVQPAAYSGGDVGYCMDQNEPGIPLSAQPSMEGYQRSSGNATRSCRPGEFFNEDVGGECQPRFQGISSAAGVRAAPYPSMPTVSLPGSILPEYGVGIMDPRDVPVHVNGRTLHLLSGN